MAAAAAGWVVCLIWGAGGGWQFAHSLRPGLPENPPDCPLHHEGQSAVRRPEDWGGERPRRDEELAVWCVPHPRCRNQRGAVISPTVAVRTVLPLPERPPKRVALHSDNKIEHILMSVKQEMTRSNNRKLKQPEEGASF